MSTIRCMVTGHRPKDLIGRYDYSHENYVAMKRALIGIMTSLSERYDKTIFISGLALGVDTVFVGAADVVKKKSTKDIEIHGYIPHVDQSKAWHEKKARDLWDYMRSDILDKEFITSDVYHGGVMNMRNQDMVNNSDVCIAVWTGKENGGTYDAVKKAIKANLRVIQLNPNTGEISLLHSPDSPSA